MLPLICVLAVPLPKPVDEDTEDELDEDSEDELDDRETQEAKVYPMIYVWQTYTPALNTTSMIVLHWLYMHDIVLVLAKIYSDRPCCGAAWSASTLHMR